jgi:hypothetical protein
MRRMHRESPNANKSVAARRQRRWSGEDGWAARGRRELDETVRLGGARGTQRLGSARRSPTARAPAPRHARTAGSATPSPTRAPRGRRPRRVRAGGKGPPRLRRSQPDRTSGRARARAGPAGSSTTPSRRTTAAARPRGCGRACDGLGVRAWSTDRCARLSRQGGPGRHPMWRRADPHQPDHAHRCRQLPSPHAPETAARRAWRSRGPAEVSSCCHPLASGAAATRRRGWRAGWAGAA